MWDIVYIQLKALLKAQADWPGKRAPEIGLKKAGIMEDLNDALFRIIKQVLGDVIGRAKLDLISLLQLPRFQPPLLRLGVMDLGELGGRVRGWRWEGARGKVGEPLVVLPRQRDEVAHLEALRVALLEGAVQHKGHAYQRPYCFFLVLVRHVTGGEAID
jgi:hypothetical protein